MRAVINAVGSYLPERIVTNSDLTNLMETSDSWIRERTGIASRHIAADGETTSDLAAAAARAALANGNINPATIDMIIVATGTPDFSMPSTAALVQAKLGIAQCAAFDIAAACSGFVYGLHISRGLIASGIVKRILLIGAETMSRLVDWEDRGTAILFGDGAGAVIIDAAEGTDRGIIDSAITADGSLHNILITTGGVSTNRQAGALTMAGKEVFRHGVDKMSDVTLELLARNNISAGTVQHVIAHQANARIIQAIAKKTGIPLDKFVMTMDHHANTSAASIPLALAEAITQQRITSGDLIAMPALGAGLTWGCCIIKW